MFRTADVYAPAGDVSTLASPLSVYLQRARRPYRNRTRVLPGRILLPVFQLVVRAVRSAGRIAKGEDYVVFFCSNYLAWRTHVSFG